mmetsp:Transcript_25538/g.87480  ORF Transcript_25538/g.87480 Transcript_25538/m.87480 type:complete len:335 (+) Transcript_25538:420-1424(+)
MVRFAGLAPPALSPQRSASSCCSPTGMGRYARCPSPMHPRSSSTGSRLATWPTSAASTARSPSVWLARFSGRSARYSSSPMVTSLILGSDPSSAVAAASTSIAPAATICRSMPKSRTAQFHRHAAARYLSLSVALPEILSSLSRMSTVEAVRAGRSSGSKGLGSTVHHASPSPSAAGARSYRSSRARNGSSSPISRSHTARVQNSKSRTCEASTSSRWCLACGSHRCAISTRTSWPLGHSSPCSGNGWIAASRLLGTRIANHIVASRNMVASGSRATCIMRSRSSTSSLVSSSGPTASVLSHITAHATASCMSFRPGAPSATSSAVCCSLPKKP